MPTEYARLQLLQEVTTKNGVQAHDLIVYRPTCRGMTDVFDAADLRIQIEKFVRHACRAVNGSDAPLEFEASELNLADSADIGNIITTMSEEADEINIEESGDGISAPVIYTLKYPISLSKDSGEVLHQLSFEAKRLKDISEYLDATRPGVGETKEFHAFMRAFAKPMGITVPVMSDAIIDALDFVDYIVIRRKIMGKFTAPRRRWKRTV
jgi:hypothetical protein